MATGSVAARPTGGAQLFCVGAPGTELCTEADLDACLSGESVTCRYGDGRTCSCLRDGDGAIHISCDEDAGGPVACTGGDYERCAAGEPVECYERTDPVASGRPMSDARTMIQRAGREPVEHQRNGVAAGDSIEVAAGDVAIFALQGQPVRVLQPGSYQVPAEFAGPAMEVFFVRTRATEGEKFGGRLPAGLPVRTAFGTCSWIIREPERVVMALGGAEGLGRLVVRTLQGEVQHHGAKAALRGAPLDGSLHGPILADANARLAPQGIEVLAIAEFALR